MKKNTAIIIGALAIIILGLACAVNTEAAERYPYIKATSTNGYFEGEDFYTSGILLECDHFPGRYWTRRSSDGWLTLAPLADDPMAAGQVFMFDRTNAVYTPGDKYGAHYEHGQWHQIIAVNSPRKWLTVRPDGFYFDTLAFNDDGSHRDAQLWRIRIISDKGTYQVVRLSSKTGNGAAAAGWGECRPRAYQ
jgi:hypothetical protein